MKLSAIIYCGFAILPLCTLADTVLVDFGGGTNSAPGWNSPDPPYMPTNLFTTNAIDTGIELYPVSWNTSDLGNIGAFSNTAPWAIPALDTCFRQIFTTYVEFNNAPTNFLYTFELISSIADDYYGGYYRINGNYADNNPSGDYYSSYYAGYIDGTVMVWSNVVPDETGSIVLEVQRGDPRSAIAINALRITMTEIPVLAITSSSRSGNSPTITITNSISTSTVYVQRCEYLTNANWVDVTNFVATFTNWTDPETEDNWMKYYYRLAR